MFQEQIRVEHLIRNLMKTFDMKLSERPVNIALVQCRFDPNNSPVPLQEWNDGRFGESTADGVIGFERKSDRGGRVTSTSKNGVYPCNKLIARHPIASSVRLPRLLPDPQTAHWEMTHSITKCTKLHIPKPGKLVSGKLPEEYWWICSRFGKKKLQLPSSD
jgi:hypothetical protein